MINQEQLRRRTKRSGGCSRRRRNQGTSVAPPPPTDGSGYADYNDPLWTRIPAGLAFEGYQPSPGVHYIQPGCEALTDIISVCYSTLIRSNSSRTRLSECAFAYYCAVACYWRLLYLHLKNGLEVTNSELSFIHHLKSLHLEVPPLIAHYLTGFGNTTIPNGREAKFRMRKIPAYCNAGNTSGWFGRVSPDTQPFYQNYPCLAVYVARMFASLEGAKRKNISWNFPAEIQPLIVGGIGPSPACIGYAPRENLSRHQRYFLEANGVLVGEPFPSSNHDLPINVNLLTAIHTELRTPTGLQLLPLPETLIGTVGQICFTVIEGEHEEGTTRATPMTSTSSWFIPAEVSSFATAFTYRVHHAVDEAAREELPHQPWVVWRFDNNAPADWAQLTAAGNSFREGEPKCLSYKMFMTAQYQIRSKLEALERTLNGKISCQYGKWTMSLG